MKTIAFQVGEDTKIVQIINYGWWAIGCALSFLERTHKALVVRDKVHDAIAYAPYE